MNIDGVEMGVRIVIDDQYIPGEADDANAEHATNDVERADFKGYAEEERRRFRENEWTAYGLISVHKCPLCDDTHDGWTVWGFVFEVDGLDRVTVWNPETEISDKGIRAELEDIMREGRAQLKG